MSPSAIPNLQVERELFDERRAARARLRRGGPRRARRAGHRRPRASSTPRLRRMPAGLRDSKLMTEPRREAMAPRAAGWVRSAGPSARRARPRSTSSASWPASGSPARVRSRRSNCRVRTSPSTAAHPRRQLRLAEPVDRASRASHDPHQGRPRLRIGGSGIRHRQGAPRRRHASASHVDFPRLRLGREQGVLEPRRTSRPSPSTARARCTGTPGCTSAARGRADALRPRRRMNPDG